MVTAGKRINKMSHSLCPYARQSALSGTFQVEAEDWKLPQEKRDSCFTGSLPALQPISHAHLGIFQATPVRTIFPLWEKCSIWLVKLTITSAAGNQKTTYLLISNYLFVNHPSQEQAAKDSAWVTSLNQPKKPHLCCSVAPCTPPSLSSPSNTQKAKGCGLCPGTA